MLKDKVKGCLYGGAAGDALGYVIEFMRENEIFSDYGKNGIESYSLGKNGKALISDDTQMTLFTAAGLLAWKAHGGNSARNYVRQAYTDWLITQMFDYADRNMIKEHSERISWLSEEERLYSTRYPGNTCLHSLIELNKSKKLIDDYITDVRNNSKGCGGIMRTAPIALLFEDIEKADTEAAQMSAITHCHSLGYMPSSVMAHIINRIVFSPNGQSLKEIVIDAKNAVSEMFRKDENTEYLTNMIDMAIRLSENGEDDLKNIHKIGGGWVAEETLGIALYCCLKYENDFSEALIVSVNHSGDSDSTGAVTGNILGALVGFERIEDKWKEHLELSDVIDRISEDICGSFDNNSVWYQNYYKMSK